MSDNATVLDFNAALRRRRDEDELSAATHVTPTESGRWLVFVEGKGYPVTVLEDLPAAPTVIVEADVTIFFDPAAVSTVIDPVFFAPSRRTVMQEQYAA
ncbi:hypothetical protein AB0383_20130 [Amycolatopsis sp. NPDC051373]|uniref:hypothetical protein n=1 Tax=Amycolatopsis sp. NPDC051373 TaxID=3155801 RepID=UPI00344B7C18